MSQLKGVSQDKVWSSRSQAARQGPELEVKQGPPGFLPQFPNKVRRFFTYFRALPHRTLGARRLRAATVFWFSFLVSHWVRRFSTNAWISQLFFSIPPGAKKSSASSVFLPVFLARFRRFFTPYRRFQTQTISSPTDRFSSSFSHRVQEVFHRSSPPVFLLVFSWNLGGFFTNWTHMVSSSVPHWVQEVFSTKP